MDKSVFVLLHKNERSREQIFSIVFANWSNLITAFGFFSQRKLVKVLTKGTTFDNFVQFGSDQRQIKQDVVQYGVWSQPGFR